MRLGIGSYAVPWTIGWDGWLPERPFEPEDLLDLALGLGAEVVQYCDNLPIDDWADRRPDRLARLKDRAAAAGVALEVGTRGLDPDRLESACRTARALGARFVRVVADSGDYRPDLATLARDLERVRPAFERHGLVLALENHDRFLAEDLADRMERSGGWLQACFDTANSLGCLQGTFEALEPLLPHVVSLHLKDVAATRVPYGLGFRVDGAPAGEGAARLREVCDRVRSIRPDATAVLEQWVPKGADRERTAAAELEWLRRGWETVRSWFDRP
ncbi:MAG: sugar phosphate isomerase/epimerase [Fimbriimonadales bacterium]|nr:sugar phosphate isomerase/epimerase [Fimbriimonadales bacterium]